jgi:prepilin-type processing-associated H-X9-DG protein
MMGRSKWATCGGLLGVGGLVTLLAILAFPFFAKGRGSRRISCPSNLKQLATGFAMYQQDYDGRFPPCAGWGSALQPYVKNEALMRCPEDDKRWSYALNSNLDRALISDIRSPERIALLFDSDLHTPNACGLAKDAVFNRHNGGANWAFVDGHVRRLEAAPAFGPVAAKRSARPLLPGSDR